MAPVGVAVAVDGGRDVVGAGGVVAGDQSVRARVAVPLPVMGQPSPSSSPPTLWTEGVLMALLLPMVSSLMVVT